MKLMNREEFEKKYPLIEEGKRKPYLNELKHEWVVEADDRDNPFKVMNITVTYED